MPKGKTMTLAVNDTELFVRRIAAQGEGKRTLMLMHGGPADGHYYRWLSPLSEYGEIIHHDYRGTGHSNRGNKSEWNFATWASDAVSLAAQLGVERPVLLGESFGGWLAQYIALQYPDFASALIFSSTSAEFNSPEVEERFASIGGEKAKKAARDFNANPNKTTFTPYRDYAFPCYIYEGAEEADDDIAEDRGEVAESNHELLYHFWGGELMAMNYLPELHKITCPSLIVAGRYDPVTPWEESLRMAENLSGSTTLSVVDRAAHGVWGDRPEVFYPTVRAFLESFC